MSYTHYADTLITLMLGWIRALTDWIWNMVNLGDGSAGRSFLRWFGSNWLKLVILMLVIGMAADWLIWLIRWKPYWLWFGKKRRIIEDANDDAPRAPKTRRPVRREDAEDAELEFPVSRRPEGPHYRSKALPRGGAADSAKAQRAGRVPEKAPRRAADVSGFEEDELFDVVSGEIARPAEESARKPRRSEEWIGEYVQNKPESARSKPESAEKRDKEEKADAIDWFDS